MTKNVNFLQGTAQQFRIDIRQARVAWDSASEGGHSFLSFGKRLTLYTIVAAKAISALALGLAVGFAIAAAVTTLSPYIAVALAVVGIVGLLIAFAASSYASSRTFYNVESENFISFIQFDDGENRRSQEYDNA